MAEEQPKKHSKKHRRKKWLVSLPIVAVVLVIGLLVFSVATYVKYNVVPSGAVFVIDGRAYSKKEVKEITAYPTKRGNMSQDEAAKKVFNLLKRKHTAEKLGINISDQAVKENSTQLFQDDSIEASSKWGQLLSYDELLSARLAANSDNKNDQIAGYAFIFLFGHCIEKGIDYTPDCLNDEKQIKKDKDYAKERAEHYRARLQSGNMKPEEALKDIQKDARLGYTNIPGSNPSTRFEDFQGIDNGGGGAVDATVTTEPLLGSVDKYLRSDKVKNGLNPIEAGKTSADAIMYEGKPNNLKETYYFFLDVEEFAKAVTKEQFNTEVKNLVAHYKGLGG